jgi:elongation factor G
MVQISDVVLMWVALEPDTPADRQRLDAALQRLSDEDPILRVTTAEAGQIIVFGAGETHLEIVVDRLRREFNVAAGVGRLQIAYKERLTVAAEGDGRFVRHSGGRGQYGHAKIRVVPLSSGMGYRFDNQIVGDAIPERFIRPVEEGIQDAIARGVIAGCPVDDVGIELVDGSHHEVDSSEAAFKIAGAMAFVDAAKKARPVLTEPVMRMEVRVPEEYLHEVMADLGRRHVQIQAREARGKLHFLKARVRLRELLGYGAQLRQLTAGRASHSLVLDRYEPVRRDDGDDSGLPTGVPRKPWPHAPGPGIALPEPDDE